LKAGEIAMLEVPNTDDAGLLNGRWRTRFIHIKASIASGARHQFSRRSIVAASTEPGADNSDVIRRDAD